MAKFVLVPGAWLGAWVWERAGPLLVEQGLSVYPVTLTGMGERVHLASKEIGIETAILDVLNIIRYNNLDDVILVGHSFAGKVVAAVADRVPEKVSMVLYLDAFRPAKVRNPQGDFGDEFGCEGWTVPLTEETIDTIGKDLQGPDREWLLARSTPWLKRYAHDPITLSTNFDSIKSAYIFCGGGGDPVDKILKEKLDGPHKVIDSGHWPMITRPKEMVEDFIALSG